MTSGSAARSALLAFSAGSLLLAGCTSAEPDAAVSAPTTAEPSGEVPPSTSRPSPSRSPSTTLPDPALSSEGLSTEAQQASTVVNSAGTGDAAITLSGVPDRAHVVVRLVCAGRGDTHVVDARGRMLIGGSCDGLNGSSIDLPDVESERFGRVRVQTSPTTRWRLFIGTY